MHKLFLNTMTAVALIGLAACGSNATEAGEAQDAAEGGAEAVSYSVQEGSQIQFHGYKIVGSGEHTGIIPISEGSVSVEGENLSAGSFTFDMTKINVLNEMPDEYKQMLMGHFASDDFFNIEAYPSSKFEITAVTAKAEGENTHEISGNLTIRDSVKNITFPAKVTLTENGIEATGKTVINRLDWGINYDKEKMSLSEELKAKAKNGLVSQDVDIEITIKAGAAAETVKTETAEESTEE